MSAQQKKVVWPALCVVTMTAIALIFAATRSGHSAVTNAERASSQFACVSDVGTSKGDTVQRSDADGRVHQNSDGEVRHSLILIEPNVVAATSAVAVDDDKGFWLTIRATGFETKEMTISAGNYFLVIQNATGLDQFGLRIEREPGQRIHEERLPRLKKHWRQMIHFTPGRYIVSEMDHPEWICRITVN